MALSKKYLTEEKFNTFLNNHFQHLKNDVSLIKGELLVLIPVVLGIFGIVLWIAKAT